MKRKRFSVEHIVAVLKQAELGAPVADLIRHLGIAEQTFYRWKRRYAGLDSEQVREFKQLQDENTTLKRLVADLSLDKAKPSFLVSHQLALDEVAEAYQQFDSRQRGWTKVILRPAA